MSMCVLYVALHIVNAYSTSTSAVIYKYLEFLQICWKIHYKYVRNMRSYANKHDYFRGIQFFLDNKNL